MDGTEKLNVYHDERIIDKEWLYHGFLYIQAEREGEYERLLRETKDRHGYRGKVHYSDITARSRAFSVARDWIDMFYGGLYKGCRYYLFGLYLPNINYDFFGKRGDQMRERRIFRRFFEIALYGSLRYFFKDVTIKVNQITTDPKKKYESAGFYEKPIKYLRERGIGVSCKKISQADDSLFLELTDVLLGAHSEVLDYSSGEEGKENLGKHICELTRDLLQRSCKQRTEYRKRHAASFFPWRKISVKDARHGKSDYFFYDRERK